MDDTDILNVAGGRGYVCWLADTEGDDYDTYVLEKVVKTHGMRITLSMKLDLYTKMIGSTEIIYRYKKVNIKKIMGALGTGCEIFQEDLKILEGKGYTIKA